MPTLVFIVQLFNERKSAKRNCKFSPAVVLFSSFLVFGLLKIFTRLESEAVLEGQNSAVYGDPEDYHLKYGGGFLHAKQNENNETFLKKKNRKYTHTHTLHGREENNSQAINSGE